MLICPDWEISVVPVSQPGTPGRDKKGGPFVPGLATGQPGQKVLPAPRGWRTLLSRLVLPTGTKVPFLFMFCVSQLFFYFNYTFAF